MHWGSNRKKITSLGLEAFKITFMTWIQRISMETPVKTLMSYSHRAHFTNIPGSSVSSTELQQKLNFTDAPRFTDESEAE